MQNHNSSNAYMNPYLGGTNSKIELNVDAHDLHESKTKTAQYYGYNAEEGDMNVNANVGVNSNINNNIGGSAQYGYGASSDVNVGAGVGGGATGGVGISGGVGVSAGVNSNVSPGNEGGSYGYGAQI